MLDNFILLIDVSLGSPAVSRQGFGTVLLLALGLGVGFTERSRSYASAASAAADTDLSADAIARVTTAFSQPSPPNLIKVGRREADVAQVVEFTVSGATDGTYTITINGEAHNFVASSSSVTLVVAGLVTAIQGGGQAAVVTATDNDPVVTVTSDVTGLPFTYSSSSTGSAIVEVEATANVSASTELTAVFAADTDWFHLVLDTRSDTDITRTAATAEGIKRLFWAQTDSSDIIASPTTDVYSGLKALSYRWTVPIYYTVDATHCDMAWAARMASFDFDKKAPTAAMLTLTGVATQAPTDTAIVNMAAKNVNFYSTLKGLGATHPGTTPVGYDVELVITGAWFEARIGENIASLLSAVSNAGERVKYNDEGFGRVNSRVEKQLQLGVTLGHVNASPTPESTFPKRADVPQVDVDAGMLRITFGAQYSGRVKTVDIDGTVSVDFTSLSAP